MTMTKTKTKTDRQRYLLALSLHIDPHDGTSIVGGDTGRVLARACVVDTMTTRRGETDRGDWEGFGFIYDDDYRHLRDYQDFRFHQWFYRNTGKGYGDGPQFEAGSYCGLEDARRYCRVLTAIDKQLTKAVSRRGYPADLADYFGRVAEAIDADCVCIERTAEAVERCGYRWRCCDIGMGVSHLRSELARIVEAENQPAEVATA